MDRNHFHPVLIYFNLIKKQRPPRVFIFENDKCSSTFNMKILYVFFLVRLLILLKICLGECKRLSIFVLKKGGILY